MQLVLLNGDDDRILRKPVMGKMRCEPDFVAGELQKREFIVEVCDVTILVWVTVHTAPLVDLTQYQKQTGNMEIEKTPAEK